MMQHPLLRATAYGHQNLAISIHSSPDYFFWMDVSLAKDLQYLVIDTNAIIAGGNFWQKAPKVVTTDEVLTEVKDKKSATFLRDLPVTIEVENPDADSILMIMKVARELGDYGSLSKADIKV